MDKEDNSTHLDLETVKQGAEKSQNSPGKGKYIGPSSITKITSFTYTTLTIAMMEEHSAPDNIETVPGHEGMESAVKPFNQTVSYRRPNGDSTSSEHEHSSGRFKPPIAQQEETTSPGVPVVPPSPMPLPVGRASRQAPITTPTLALPTNAELPCNSKLTQPVSLKTQDTTEQETSKTGIKEEEEIACNNKTNGPQGTIEPKFSQYKKEQLAGQKQKLRTESGGENQPREPELQEQPHNTESQTESEDSSPSEGTEEESLVTVFQKVYDNRRVKSARITRKHSTTSDGATKTTWLEVENWKPPYFSPNILVLILAVTVVFIFITYHD